jgi:hypothetical protein
MKGRINPYTLILLVSSLRVLTSASVMKVIVFFVAWTWIFQAAMGEGALRLEAELQEHRDLQITEFQLIDTVSDKVVAILQEGMVIPLADLGMTSPSFSVNAIFSGPNVISVKYGLDGNPNHRVENKAPFALCGNKATDFFLCRTLGIGAHTVTATPYASRNGRGAAGTSFTVGFTIVASLPPKSPPVKPPVTAPSGGGTVGQPTSAPARATAPQSVTPPFGTPVAPPVMDPPKSTPVAPPVMDPPKSTPVAPPLTAPTKTDPPPVARPMSQPVMPVAPPVKPPSNPTCEPGYVVEGGKCIRQIVDDVPKLSKEDIVKVMDWIKSKVTQAKAPFCWKNTYGRGVGTIPDSYGRGGGYPWFFGDCFCNDGMIGRCENDNGKGNCEMWAAIAYPKCKPGFSPAGCCVCSGCSTGLVNDAGLCYPPCENTHYGVGPVCWAKCPDGTVDCGTACAADSGQCVSGVFNQAVAPFILAANVLTLGLAAPLTGALSITIKTVQGVTKVVGGTSRVGKAFVATVNKLQTVSPNKERVSVLTRLRNPKNWDEILGEVYSYADLSMDTFEAMEELKNAFSDDFATQTSDAVNNELNRRFDARTAKYLKEAWMNVRLKEMGDAYAWQIADTALNTIAMVDITGITGVVAAYAKPSCSANTQFPCIPADRTQCA